MAQVDTLGRHRVRHSWGHQVSPSEPVSPSSSDPENFRRFPRGYAHIVTFGDGCDRSMYAVRMRCMDGHLDIIGDETSDRDVAKERLSILYLEMRDAWFLERGWGEEGESAQERNAAWPTDHGRRSYVFGIEDVVWPHMRWRDPDYPLLAALPDGCPTIQESSHRFHKYYAVGWKEDGTIPYLTRSDPSYADALTILTHSTLVGLRNWETYVRPEQSRPGFSIHR